MGDFTSNWKGKVKYLYELMTGAVRLPAGLAFPATQVPSSDANTLDDYEEGTFTPLLQFGGASVGITYTSQLGKYTKIGRVVFVNIYVTLSNKGSSSGIASIEGLPFAAAASFNVPLTVIYQLVDLNVAGGFYAPAAYIPQNGAGVLLFEQGDNAAIALLTEADFGNTSVVILSGFYHV